MMLIAFSQMKGSSIEGVDPDGNEKHLGSLVDLIFDGSHFVVRYVSVDLGRWLPGRQIPIRPMELSDCQWRSRSVRTKLERRKLEESPNIDSAIPVSRRMEIELAQYFQWTAYWSLESAYGAYPSIGLVAPSIGKMQLESEVEAEHDNLRSAAEVLSTSVHETDGELGAVNDLIIDDEFWILRYIVVDTGKWLPGKKVLLAAEWIERISWSEQRVFVKLNKSDVTHAPTYNSNDLINRSTEEQLYDYHGRPAYWH